MKGSAVGSLQQRIKKHFSKRDGIIFCVTFVLAMLVHLYMFTHKFINHDDLDGLYSSCAFGLSSGRWLLETLCGLTGNFSSSWLNGLAGAMCLAGAVTLIMNMLKIRHLVPAFLGIVCLVAFPTVASTYAYMFSSAPYLAALFLAVLGAWLIRKEGLPMLLLGSVFIALSMGGYQAYFCLAAVLLVVLLTMDLCRDRWGGDSKMFMKTAALYLGSLALGMILYYVILQFLLKVTGTELVSYQGISEMGKLTLSTLLERIRYAYRLYFDFFANRWMEIWHGFFPVVAVLCMAVNLGMVAWCVVHKKLYRRPMTLIFLALLLVIFPLASNLVIVMAGWETTHLLMVYPLAVTLLLPAVAVDRLKLPTGRIKRSAVSLLTVGLILLQGICAWECVLITNRAYFSMDVTYENAYAYFTKLTAKIELTEGYTAESRVALMGRAQMDSAVPETYLTGVITGNQALNVYSRTLFLEYFLGTKYPYVSQEEQEGLKETAEFAAMPVYPAEGSIRNVDGVIVVKLS